MLMKKKVSSCKFYLATNIQFILCQFRSGIQISRGLSVFFYFFNNKKWFFAFFYQVNYLIWLGVGFLNRTGAEIGYKLDKKWKKTFFIIEKI